MSDPKVSVIIPNYNYGRFLRECIDSVLRQEEGNLEVIVVDNGSTDETPSVLAAVTDPRLRTFRIDRCGAGGGRNHGLENARGEFVAFLDSDDRWRPDKLKIQVDLLRAEPSVGAVFCDFIRFNPAEILPNQFIYHPELAEIPARDDATGRGKVILGDSFLHLLAMEEFPILPSSLVYRRSAIGGLRFDRRLRISEDLHFAMRIYEKTDVAYVPEVLLEVRRHENNCAEDIADMIDQKLKALRILETECSPGHREAVRARTGRCWSALGYHYFWNRQPLSAAGAYGRALAYPGGRLNAAYHLAACPLSLFMRPRNSSTS
jgi:glycosyltransferase involved in cell wall biosynthesis